MFSVENFVALCYEKLSTEIVYSIINVVSIQIHMRGPNVACGSYSLYLKIKKKNVNN